jgi:tellurite methyltransferase
MKSLNPHWEAEYRDQTAITFGPPSEELVTLADRLSPETDVLDVGCGDGRNALVFANRGFRVRAFDISEAGINKLRIRAASQGLEIDAWVQDIRHFDFDQSYGLIICHGVLHLLGFGVCRKFLKETRDHTVEGGFNVHTVFTDRFPPPPDLRPFVRRLFKEGELRDIYRDWEIEKFESYIKSDQHSGGVQHRHPINKLVARKPCGV